MELSLLLTGRIPSLDVGFIVDASDDANWQQTLNAISSIVDNLDVSQGGTHIGFIPFSSSASVAVAFPVANTRPYNPSVVKNLINSVAQSGGSERRVDEAFLQADVALFVPRNGTRQASKQVCQQTGITNS